MPALGGFAETVEHGETGLLFPAADVKALSEQLIDIANGRSFPEHTLDPARVAQVQVEYGREMHIAKIRAIMYEIISSHD